MKKLLILVLLALGATHQSEAKQVTGCHTTACCNPRQLPEPVKGLITITQSGSYRFTHDICADILIDADDVCLDLNCFTLKGTGFNPGTFIYAIVAQDHTNITIKNGTIKNPEFFGIGLFGCSQLQLEGLKIKTVEVAIVIDRSQLNSTTSHGCLTDIDVSGNSSTQLGTLIRIHNGDTFSLNKVNVSDCIVSRPQFTGGLVDIGGVSKLTISCCKINNNESQDQFLFVPLVIEGGDDISVEDTKVNDNKVTFPDLSVGMINTLFETDNNCSIKRCQFNGSTVAQSTFCYGLAIAITNNFIVDCCETNGTTLKLAVPLPISPGGPEAVGASGIIIFNAQDFAVHNSEANNTTHTDNQPNQTEFSGPEGIMLIGAANGSVEKCRTNGTTSLGINAVLACGFLTYNCFNIHVSRSESLKTSSLNAYGFAAIEGNFDITFSNCVGSNNTGSNFAAGFITLNNDLTQGPVLPNENISFKENCAENNQASNAYGFLIFGNTINCLVINSQARNNTTAGIQIGFPPFVVQTHSDPKIIGNCAENNGAGFVVEAIGSNILNPLLLDNKAIKNTNCGFQQSGLIFNPIYAENKAQGNGTDFCNFSNFDGTKSEEGKLTCKGS